MEAIRILGGRPLKGAVTAAGAKNSALPIMAASILASAPVLIDRVPELSDVRTMALLLGHLGVEVKRRPSGEVAIQTVDGAPDTAEAELVSKMRASFCVLGPLVARRGRACVSLPGGCNLGPRPVDLHLSGLAALGVELRIERGRVMAHARQLRGAQIQLMGPCGPSVTATAHVMSVAAVARGTTVIRGAAREPEIIDLGRFLKTLGAQIEGLGTSDIHIQGVEQLGGGRHTIIPDRIETGTLLLAGAITGGNVTVAQAEPAHLGALLAVLREAGAQVSTQGSSVNVQATGRPRPLNLSARPYPGLPTDLQAQAMAWLCLADGESSIRDYVFPERFQHVTTLRRLGARIEQPGTAAIVRGVARFNGDHVTACDLRASAALVLAGLAAQGTTTVTRVDYLDRGYEQLEQKLAALGAQIERVTISAQADAPAQQLPSSAVALRVPAA